LNYPSHLFIREFSTLFIWHLPNSDLALPFNILHLIKCLFPLLLLNTIRSRMHHPYLLPNIIISIYNHFIKNIYQGIWLPCCQHLLRFHKLYNITEKILCTKYKNWHSLHYDNTLPLPQCLTLPDNYHLLTHNRLLIKFVTVLILMRQHSYHFTNLSKGSLMVKKEAKQQH